MKKLILILSLICLTACDSPQKIARDAIAGSKGVLETAQKQYSESCNMDATLQQCVLVHKAIAAQNVAVDALEEYCSGGNFATGGACTPDKSVEPKLRNAINNLNQIMADVKGVIR